jgi:hypothetical protein
MDHMLQVPIFEDTWTEYPARLVKLSVPDPFPDPPDSHVFGPPRSGSILVRGTYGSESFGKIVRKTLIPTVL